MKNWLLQDGTYSEYTYLQLRTYCYSPYRITKALLIIINMVLLETFHFAYFAKHNCLLKYEKLKCNGICRSFLDELFFHFAFIAHYC